LVLSQDWVHAAVVLHGAGPGGGGDPAQAVARLWASAVLGFVTATGAGKAAVRAMLAANKVRRPPLTRPF
jgi:hypothetical protein